MMLNSRQGKRRKLGRIPVNRPKHLRILGLLALLAFGLHGAQALGHDHESGVETDCVICHGQQLTALAADLACFDSRLPDPVGAVAEEARPAARPASLACHASRGPPA